MSPPSVQKDKPNKTFVVNPILVGKPLVYTYSIPAFKQILASGAPFGKPFTSKQYLKYVMSKLKIKRPHPVLRRVLLLPVFWEKMLSPPMETFGDAIAVSRRQRLINLRMSTCGKLQQHFTRTCSDKKVGKKLRRGALWILMS